MDWNQVLTIVGTNIALILASLGTTITLFLWTRSESRSDWKHMDAKLDANREEIRANREETNKILSAIQQEIKDFHTRLIKIEESRK